jgi:3-methyladenine DNA glycosylase AlkC
MHIPQHTSPTIPWAPRAIQKGVPLKNVLGEAVITHLARNISLSYPAFDSQGFCHLALTDIEPLALTQRGQHIAEALWHYLPKPYSQAIAIILASLTEIKTQADEFGLAEMFYMPHCQLIATYGLNPAYNNGVDPFDLSMQAQYELTRRFTAEFSMRPYLQAQPQRTLAVLDGWLEDTNPHVRRLCCEATRPRLPWSKQLKEFIADPQPLLPIFAALKDDESLYVRRSVANNMGDVCKDHPQLIFDLCESWLAGASKERKWLIRHALRHPAKKQEPRALAIRLAAK